MRIDIAAQTDIGRRKSKNEDYYGVFREDTPDLRLFEEGALLCVADGLGGHIGGEIASKLAVSVVKDVLKLTPPPPAENPEEDEGPLPYICQQIISANDNIFKTNQELVKTGRPMGTTLLAALITDGKLYIGNVGDSRCYHFRDGEIIAKTEDHSWVDEQVKMGLMSKAEAQLDSRRHMVTRSIGTHPEVDIDSYRWDIAPGDMLLLCTDGLINMVKDADIKEVFSKDGSPAEIAHRLVTMANENGGKDNITVIVADISPSLTTLTERRIKAFSRRRGAKILWLLLALLYGALCLGVGFWVSRFLLE
jgi:protein phosphatase